MFERLRRILSRLRSGPPGLSDPPSTSVRRAQGRIESLLERAPQSIHEGAIDGIELTGDLEGNLRAIEQLLSKAPDLVVRRLTVGSRAAAVVFFDTLCRADHVAIEVIKPLSFEWDDPEALTSAAGLQEALRTRLVYTAGLAVAGTLKEAVTGMAQGKAALLVDGFTFALLINLVGYETRNVNEPAAEPVVRGPREGLVENLHTNVSLIRRRLATPLLRFDVLTLGRLTQTKVMVTYIHGIADDSLVREVQRRLTRIETDAILDTSYIEEFIEDAPNSVFPQILTTERPDTVVAALLEGRVAILCDGSPVALIVPTTLWALMGASEDHYQRWDGASLVRLLRYTLVSLVLLLPSIYVAATTFHPEMLPGTMLISIAAAREGVPFSSFTEVLAMEITFEALREAGIRLPRPIGQTIGIVGAIVIGEAAVSAQLVSASVVIIVAFTGISSFVIPHFNLGIAFRILRFPILILAGSLGLFGIAIGIMLIILHLVTLHSFGQPYLAPVSPLRLHELKDTFIRLPRWSMLRRPRMGPNKTPGRRMAYPSRPNPSDHPEKGGQEDALE